MGKVDHKEAVLVTGLVFFLALWFFCSGWLRFKAYDPYAGDITYFDELYFRLPFRHGNLGIRCYTDRENDSSDHWIFLPSFADTGDITVEFMESDHILVKEASGKESSLYYGDCWEGLAEGQRYEVSFIDGRGEVLESGGLTVLRSDGISAMFVDLVKDDLELIHEDKEYRARGKAVLFGQDGRAKLDEEIKFLKGHGNTTWNADKKPYLIKFSHPVSPFGFSKGKSWVLLANALDPSGIRNEVAYEIARRAGLPGVTDSAFLDLYIDGEYCGLYQLAEKVEVGANRVAITDLEKLNESFYDPKRNEGERIRKEAGEYGERIGYDFDGVPADISGGYLIERNYDLKYEAGLSRFKTDSGDQYIVRSPEYASIQEVDYIADLFTKLDTLAESGDASVGELIDLSSFAEKYVFDELVKNDGAGATSAWYYKDRDSVDPKIYAGPVWDYDKSLGNGLTNINDSPITLNLHTVHRENTKIFLNLYRNNPEYRELVRRIYAERFHPVLEDFFRDGGLVEECAWIWEQNNRMDEVRWGTEREKRLEETAMVKDFLRRRRDFLDRVWIDEEEVRTVIIRKGRKEGDIYAVYLKGDRLGKGFGRDSFKDVRTGRYVNEDTVVDKDMILEEVR